uniref:Uncharacterized protein n=1 Tax=Kalanchoe fedtschenkoi TaxID=63787 RepID=A0A7N0REZ6_KALFE
MFRLPFHVDSSRNEEGPTLLPVIKTTRKLIVSCNLPVEDLFGISKSGRPLPARLCLIVTYHGLDKFIGVGTCTDSDCRRWSRLEV